MKVDIYLYVTENGSVYCSATHSDLPGSSNYPLSPVFGTGKRFRVTVMLPDPYVIFDATPKEITEIKES